MPRITGETANSLFAAWTTMEKQQREEAEAKLKLEMMQQKLVNDQAKLQADVAYKQMMGRFKEQEAMLRQADIESKMQHRLATDQHRKATLANQMFYQGQQLVQSQARTSAMTEYYGLQSQKLRFGNEINVANSKAEQEVMKSITDIKTKLSDRPIAEQKAAWLQKIGEIYRNIPGAVPSSKLKDVEKIWFGGTGKLHFSQRIQGGSKWIDAVDESGMKVWSTETGEDASALDKELKVISSLYSKFTTERNMITKATMDEFGMKDSGTDLSPDRIVTRQLEIAAKVHEKAGSFEQYVGKSGFPISEKAMEIIKHYDRQHMGQHYDPKKVGELKTKIEGMIKESGDWRERVDAMRRDAKNNPELVAIIDAAMEDIDSEYWLSNSRPLEAFSLGAPDLLDEAEQWELENPEEDEDEFED